MTVTLVEKYNPEWPDWFEAIKSFLGEEVSRASLRIEHVGSTSIPGMVAKPIIDIIIVIEPERWEDIKAILEEAGSSMDLVVSTFVFMADLTEFSKMNEIYAEYFNVNPPGRTTVEVQSLPAGAHVEITATALAGT